MSMNPNAAVGRRTRDLDEGARHPFPGRRRRHARNRRFDSGQDHLIGFTRIASAGTAASGQYRALDMAKK